MTVLGKRVVRRLSAILVADMAGYSRMMAADEEGTLARLIWTPTIGTSGHYHIFTR